MTSLKEESKADQTAAIAEAIHDWQTIVSEKASDNAIEASFISGTLALLKSKKIDPYLEDVGQSASASYQPDLDRPGTDLWNACREASAQYASPGSRCKSISEVQAIAASMINRGTSNTATGHIRVLKVVLLTVRFLLENVQLKLALGNLTVAARRLEALRLVSSSVDNVLFQSLTAEYYMLRVKLACMECRPDLAEFHFSQKPPVKSINNAGMVIKTCFEIACDPLLARGNRLKVRWLQRAVDLFDECNQDKEREEKIPGYVGLTLRHTLVQTYLSVNTAKAREKLQQHLKVLKMVSSMDYEVERRVLFLYLDIIRRTPNPSNDEYYEYLRVLHDIFTTIPLTRGAVDLVSLMISTFKDFLLLLAEQQLDMIQHAFLPFVRLAVDSDLSQEDKISEISETVNALYEKGVEPLSQANAHSVYALAARQIETSWRNGHHPQAQQWCQFLIDASSTLLREASEANKVKNKKNFVLCALRCEDFEAARRVVAEIPRYLDENTGEFDSDAMFLEYKVKLNLCEVNDESPCACQNHLSLHPTEVGKFSEVMKAIHKMASFVHRLVIENDDPSPALRDAEKEVSLITLYVLSDEVEKENIEQSVPDTMTHYLGIASNRMHQPWDVSPENQYYTADETRWICDVCFELAWKLVNENNVALIGRLIETYSTLSGAYGNAPAWLGTVPADGITRTELDQVQISLLEIARHNILARGDGGTEGQGPAWHYEQMKTLINSTEDSLGVQRVLTLYAEEDNAGSGVWVMYMEACLFLQDWPEATRGILNSSYMDSEDITKMIIHKITGLHICRKMKVYMLRRLFCGFWERNPFTRWMCRIVPYVLRMIIDLCMEGSPTQRVPSLRQDFDITSRPQNLEARASANEGTMTYLEIAELVLRQAINLIENGRYNRSRAHQEMHRAALENEGPSVCNNLIYPPSEIAYLATIAFNQALDFYAEEKDADHQRWAEKAIELAEKIETEDGPPLVQLFKTRLEELVAETQEAQE
ncbi:hypothetical protein N7528_007099 [Penicillium herquei]|nr:hypothetical protein N7528_007099 [Penicillium herquei]